MFDQPSSTQVVVLSGPSGSGKTTIVERLIREAPIKLVKCVSATTRPPRRGEVHGDAYYFLSSEEFAARRTRDEFLETAEVFVFGSLAARQAPSRETLYRLLQQAKLKVFDVNLRPPHYSRDVVTYLLNQADVVKLNHHELAEIMDWFGVSSDEETALRWLAERFQLQVVCVTKGANGAILWVEQQLYRSSGIAVQVQDTIGSGDAFLAALLRGWLAGQPPADYLAFACAAGSLVASYKGATPAISEAQVRDLAATAFSV